MNPRFLKTERNDPVLTASGNLLEVLGGTRGFKEEPNLCDSSSSGTVEDGNKFTDLNLILGGHGSSITGADLGPFGTICKGFTVHDDPVEGHPSRGETPSLIPRTCLTQHANLLRFYYSIRTL